MAYRADIAQVKYDFGIECTSCDKDSTQIVTYAAILAFESKHHAQEVDGEVCMDACIGNHWIC